MTYPNMDLQSLPADIDLRVGTDQAERALQLSYWQIWAGVQAVNAGDEAAFDTALTNLLTDLVAAMVHYDEIWAMVP
jgi:hypothetical protein